MAERVEIVRLGHRDGAVARVDPRLARHLVSRGTHAYVDAAAAEEAPPPAKRASSPKKAKPKGDYRRRDLKAEGE